MEFLPIPGPDALTDEAREAKREELDDPGRPITGMKATLLGHPPSFRVYMQWYTLKDELVPVLGERGVGLLSWAISDENDCAPCAAWFADTLGEDPHAIEPTPRERLVIDFGRSIARDPRSVPDDLYAAVSEEFAAPERVQLVAFAGLVVALNVFNTVGRLPTDADVSGLRAESAEPEVEMDSLESGAE